MKDILNSLFQGNTLSKQEAQEILREIALEKHNPSQVVSFITVFRMRSPTLDELEGFRETMLELCVSVDLAAYDPLDLCGTGGDEKDTLNISTIASFIAAGAGVKIAKHGNSGVSSVCGSSDVLQHLGITVTNNPETIEQCIEEAGICFLHAPLFHPAMKSVAPLRREMGVKTFFNMLGPLVNPARPKKQLIGVYNLELLRVYSYLLQKTEMSYVLVHSLDGYDEVSLTGPCKIVARRTEEVVEPSDLGFEKVEAEEIRGGETVEESARIFFDVLQGKGTKAHNSVVVANAGLALHGANPQLSRSEALARAQESLESGKALKNFECLQEICR